MTERACPPIVVVSIAVTACAWSCTCTDRIVSRTPYSSVISSTTTTSVMNRPMCGNCELDLNDERQVPYQQPLRESKESYKCPTVNMCKNPCQIVQCVICPELPCATTEIPHGTYGLDSLDIRIHRTAWPSLCYLGMSDTVSLQEDI